MNERQSPWPLRRTSGSCWWLLFLFFTSISFLATSVLASIETVIKHSPRGDSLVKAAESVRSGPHTVIAFQNRLHLYCEEFR